MRYAPVVIAGFLLCASGVAQQQSLRRAPGFSLPDQNQKQHDLQDYRGRWVLLDFMKSDCVHCQTFAPVLEQAKARYGAKLAILSVAMLPDNPQSVKKFAAQYKVTTPFLFDCGQMAYSYILPSLQHPAVELPHLYIINPDGFIVRDITYMDSTKQLFEPASLFADLDRLMGGKPTPPKTKPKK